MLSEPHKLYDLTKEKKCLVYTHFCFLVIAQVPSLGSTSLPVCSCQVWAS